MGENVGDAAERGIKRTLGRRVEKETTKNIDRALHSVIGGSSPVADNNSSTGKAQNRRVEFIKL